MIAQLAMEKKIAANILSANTKTIEGKSYGNMILGISGGPEKVREAMDYFAAVGDVIVEEVTDHVR